jgi:hypothetical protein
VEESDSDVQIVSKPVKRPRSVKGKMVDGSDADPELEAALSVQRQAHEQLMVWKERCARAEMTVNRIVGRARGSEN